MQGTKCYCQQKTNITICYNGHFDIFNVTDFQLMELNDNFLETSGALSHVDEFKSFSLHIICYLVSKFIFKTLLSRKRIFENNSGIIISLICFMTQNFRNLLFFITHVKH